MTESRVKKYWLVVVLAICVSAIAVMAAVAEWVPAHTATGTCVGLGLIGAAFVWAYATDRTGRWWAIIPGLSMFAVIGAIATDLVMGTEVTNDWASVLVLGVSAAIIGAVLKRADAKMTLYVVSSITNGVGVLMSPASGALKVILIVVDVAVAIAVVYRANRGRPMISTRGWLHPQP